MPCQRVLSIVLVLSVSLAASAQVESAPKTAATPNAGTGRIMLQDATPVKLRLSRNVSSAEAHTGDTVDFEVLEEVKVGELIVIPKGALAIGTVTEAEHKRRMARGGKLDMTIDYVRLTNNDKAPLRGVREAKGGGHTGGMTAGIVVTGLVVWPAAPFFLFMHGKDITIPKGTEITAYINGDTPLDPRKFVASSTSDQSLPTGGLETTPASSAAAAQGASLEIVSTPPGAEIELDGSFAGNTPSTIGVQPGEHTITVSKPGYTPWKRTIKTTTGAIKLTPELQPEIPK